MLALGDDRSVTVVIVIGVMAALGGFLFFNWHPSRMYMGDTGQPVPGRLSWPIVGHPLLLERPVPCGRLRALAAGRHHA